MKTVAGALVRPGDKFLLFAHGHAHIWRDNVNAVSEHEDVAFDLGTSVNQVLLAGGARGGFICSSRNDADHQRLWFEVVGISLTGLADLVERTELVVRPRTVKQVVAEIVSSDYRTRTFYTGPHDDADSLAETISRLRRQNPPRRRPVIDAPRVGGDQVGQDIAVDEGGSFKFWLSPRGVLWVFPYDWSHGVAIHPGPALVEEGWDPTLGEQPVHLADATCSEDVEEDFIRAGWLRGGWDVGDQEANSEHSPQLFLEDAGPKAHLLERAEIAVRLLHTWAQRKKIQTWPEMPDAWYPRSVVAEIIDRRGGGGAVIPLRESEDAISALARWQPFGGRVQNPPAFERWWIHPEDNLLHALGNLEHQDALSTLGSYESIDEAISEGWVRMMRDGSSIMAQANDKTAAKRAIRMLPMTTRRLLRTMTIDLVTGMGHHVKTFQMTAENPPIESSPAHPGARPLGRPFEP